MVGLMAGWPPSPAQSMITLEYRFATAAGLMVEAGGTGLWDRPRRAGRALALVQPITSPKLQGARLARVQRRPSCSPPGRAESVSPGSVITALAGAVMAARLSWPYRRAVTSISTAPSLR